MIQHITVDGFRVPGWMRDLDSFRRWAETLEDERARLHYDRGCLEVDVPPD